MSPTAVVTGASRGVGARVAALLAASGHDVVINYRCRSVLADRVAAEVRRTGRRALTCQADLTDPDAVAHLVDSTRAEFGTVDVLVLNASGGLEAGMPADYPHRVNVVAPLAVLDGVTAIMPTGSRVVYVTSHHAHFYGRVETLPAYAPVAASKRAGEDALRGRLPELARRGIGFAVVSGDVIEGTVTEVWLRRRYPEAFAQRRANGDEPIGLDEFASEVVRAAAIGGRPPGTTIYVGATHS